MAFPRTVIQKAFDEMNLVSLSPVLLFDAGRIGDSNGRSSSRYSLGGGVRLTVASSVSFEVDYARNLKPQPGEGPGALLVAARFIDLLGK
jgi:hemolysin activation/secretion protein